MEYIESKSDKITVSCGNAVGQKRIELLEEWDGFGKDILDSQVRSAYYQRRLRTYIKACPDIFAAPDKQVIILIADDPASTEKVIESLRHAKYGITAKLTILTNAPNTILTADRIVVLGNETLDPQALLTVKPGTIIQRISL